MHVLILSKRNGQAQTRLLETAGALAEYFELDPALVEALRQNSKDPAVRSLKEREAVADLLQALGLKIGAVQEAAPEPEATVTAVTDESEQVPVPFTEGVKTGSEDELPPPVIEPIPAEEVPAMSDDELITEPVETRAEPEVAIEETPAEEIIEEAPKPKPSRKKSTTKSSKKK